MDADSFFNKEDLTVDDQAWNRYVYSREGRKTGAYDLTRRVCVVAFAVVVWTGIVN